MYLVSNAAWSIVLELSSNLFNVMFAKAFFVRIVIQMLNVSNVAISLALTWRLMQSLQQKIKSVKYLLRNYTSYNLSAKIV